MPNKHIPKTITKNRSKEHVIDMSVEEKVCKRKREREREKERKRYKRETRRY